MKPFAVFVVLLFLASGCHHASEPPLDTLKDPRTYTWTIDTLKYPGSFQTMMRYMFAASASDIYIVGHNDRHQGMMYHYDGKLWSPVPLVAAEGGSIPNGVELINIFGYDGHDIYVVGERVNISVMDGSRTDSTLVLHYDGAQWSEFPLRRGGILSVIAGNSKHQIAIGGRGSQLLLFDGTSWQWDSVQVTVPVDGYFNINAVAVTEAGEIYALGYTHQNAPKDTWYVFRKGRFGTWGVIDSTATYPGHVVNLWGYSGLYASPWGKLYSLGPGIYEFNSGTWTMIFDNHMDGLAKMYALSERSIFTVGVFGKLFHFNGSDWYQFQQFAQQTLVLSDVWSDGKEAFVIGYEADGSKTYVLHGR